MRFISGNKHKPFYKHRLFVIVASIFLLAICVLGAGALYVATAQVPQQAEEKSQEVNILAPQPFIQPQLQPLAAVVSQGIDISLSIASADDMLEVRVCDLLGDPVRDVSFVFTLTDPEFSSTTYTMKDKTGIFEVRSLTKSGIYVVTLHPTEGFALQAPQTCELSPKVVKKPIAAAEIKKIVKKESEIDQSKEAPQISREPETAGPAPVVIPVVESTTEQVTTTVKETKYKSAVALTVEGYFSGSDNKLMPTVDGNGYIVGIKEKVVVPATNALVTAETEGETSPSGSSGDNSNSVQTPTEEWIELPQAQVFNSDGSINIRFAPFVTQITIDVPTETKTVYTGWQTIDGNKYYYDASGNFSTGFVSIGGITYFFSPNGVLSSTVDGIDISKYQPNVNWGSVKASGIDFVIIRVGYRGYSTGVIVEDPYFRSHINGATAAGLKVGIYFFTQAVTTQEAVEEASFCLAATAGYNLPYGITFDTENQAGGRANNISAALRTSIANAFCDTVRAGGRAPMIYASKSWFLNQLHYSAISHNRIWLAHYTAKTDFNFRYDIWQYTGQGVCPGIAGNVDKNYSYLVI